MAFIRPPNGVFGPPNPPPAPKTEMAPVGKKAQLPPPPKPPPKPREESEVERIARIFDEMGF